MKSPLQTLLVARLHDAEAMPLAARAKTYRAVATVCGCESAATRLNALAAECEALERQCGQLALDFKRRAQG
jgi:hypothetical protein